MQDIARHLAQARGFLRFLPVAQSARRVAQSEHGNDHKQQAGQGDNLKCGAPSVMMVHPPADQKGDQQADIDAERENRERRGALIGRIHIGNHGVRGRAGSCFADTDADARQQKLYEILSKAANNRHD